MSYPQCNGQAEASHKTIINEIKKRLEKAKDKWVEELPSVLWDYLTTLWKATNEAPYSLAFDFESIILLEVKFPTIRTKAYDDDHKFELLAQDLALAKEKNSLIQMPIYQK